ncbi:MAG: PIN domain-containing protein [Chloroflexota bacterium]
MPPILIDTNLLTYLYDTQSPHKAARARQVLEHLHLTRSGRLSVQSLAEFLSVATRKLDPSLSRAEALEQVSLFTRLWPVFDLTALIVLEAARGARDYGLAYYDAQIWAAARLNQVAVIFSEDFSDGQTLEGVRFANPFGDSFRVQDWT